MALSRISIFVLVAHPQPATEEDERLMEMNGWLSLWKRFQLGAESKTRTIPLQICYNYHFFPFNICLALAHFQSFHILYVCFSSISISVPGWSKIPFSYRCPIFIILYPRINPFMRLFITLLYPHCLTHFFFYYTRVLEQCFLRLLKFSVN